MAVAEFLSENSEIRAQERLKTAGKAAVWILKYLGEKYCQQFGKF
jgi:hypothetical protein